MTKKEKIRILVDAIRQDCKDALCRDQQFDPKHSPCWHMEILMSVGEKP
jgi:hypothetical protein